MRWIEPQHSQRTQRERNGKSFYRKGREERKGVPSALWALRNAMVLTATALRRNGGATGRVSTAKTRRAQRRAFGTWALRNAIEPQRHAYGRQVHYGRNGAQRECRFSPQRHRDTDKSVGDRSNAHCHCPLTTKPLCPQCLCGDISSAFSLPHSKVHQVHTSQDYGDHKELHGFQNFARRIRPSRWPRWA
jgi:hypothetical protein